MHRQRSYIHEVHVSRATGQHNDVVPGGDGRRRGGRVVCVFRGFRAAARWLSRLAA